MLEVKPLRFFITSTKFGDLTSNIELPTSNLWSNP